MAKQYKRINRFTSLPYVIDILATEQLTLTNPENWPDKNEKITLEKYRKAKGAEKIFCLCLSDSAENIHLWSNFAPSESGCFIKFNYDKLIEFLNEQKDLVYSNMEYVKIGDLSKLTIETEKLPFYKRHPFQPENELRIIYLDYDGVKEPVKKIPFDINIIESITISDQLPKPVFENVKVILQSVNKSFTGKISQSTLFENIRWKNNFEKHLIDSEGC